MAMTEHPENLLAFVSGQLSEPEAEAVISHLAECDRCLTTVDDLWQDSLRHLTERPSPSLDQETAKRLEGRLLRQIHRTDLGGRAVWLGTAGLLDTTLTLAPSLVDTYLALLRPVFNIKQSSSQRRRNT